MKRYITYMYLYEKATSGEMQKVKNVGFIRLDVYDEVFKMEIHIKNLGRYKGKANVYMLLNSDGLKRVKISDIEIINGAAAIRLESDIHRVFDCEYSFEQVIGVRIEPLDDYFIASCWKEDETELILRPAADIEQKIIPLPEPEEFIESVKETEKAEAAEGLEFSRIDISEIKKLPKKNWYLSNNSFLLHGYFNYHYLVIHEITKDGKTTKYIGVPGIYEEPERMMALLFGFTDYVEGPDAPVGYWLCRLEE